MTYLSNFVAVIKYNGKILRERNDFVTLPFGSEYSILLKNLEARKAVVKLFVDGEDVLDGNSIIIHPNNSMELKGFMKGTRVTNKFKFIQKTEEIVDHRGDKIDDGIIRVEFKFEKKKVTKIVEERRYRRYDPLPWYVYPTCPRCGWWPCVCITHRPSRVGDWMLDDDNNNTGSDCAYYNMSSNVSYGSSPTMKCNSFSSTPLADEGLTVKGSKTRQDFTYGSTKELEEMPSVIIIRLRGVKRNGTSVRKPLTVKTKLECPTCGRKNKSTNQFCGNCGTFLE